MDCSDIRIPTKWRTKPVQVGAELQLFPAKQRGLNPYLEVKTKFALQPAFTHRLGVYEWLTRTRFYIFSLLTSLAEPPDELWSLGVELPADGSPP